MEYIYKHETNTILLLYCVCGVWLAKVCEEQWKSSAAAMVCVYVWAP